MNTQINLRLPEKLLISARAYSKKNGFGTLQEFIKETIREKLFEDEEDELTPKEMALIEKLIEVSDKHGLYCSEEELFEALGRKTNKRKKRV